MFRVAFIIGTVGVEAVCQWDMWGSHQSGVRANFLFMLLLTQDE